MLMFYASMGLLCGLGSSILIGVCQVNFFSSWACLELNMMMFLAVMGVAMKSTPEASMKYFIVQSVGSSVFLWGVGLESLGLGGISGIWMATALSLKLGIAPFQGWFISVLSSLEWELVFVASTLQKMLPVFLLSSLKFESLALFMGLSVLVSVLGSVNQTFLKKILAYSSIFMTIWLIACEGEVAKSLEYLVAYSVALGVVLAGVTSTLAEDVSEVASSTGGMLVPLIMGGFLSMGGCPPFVGFYAKVTVILGMLGHGQLIWALVLVLISVFLLYVYMRMFYSGLGFNKGQWTTFSVSRGALGLSLALWGLLILPMVLCLGVEHSKFWTFKD